MGQALGGASSPIGLIRKSVTSNAGVQRLPALFSGCHSALPPPLPPTDRMQTSFPEMRSAAAILLLLAVFLPSTATASAYYGLGSFLSEQYRKDPKGYNDSFSSIPSAIKRSLSLPSPQTPAAPASLFNRQVNVPVTVKLVGPAFISSSPPLFTSYLTSAVSSDNYHVITSPPPLRRCRRRTERIPDSLPASGESRRIDESPPGSIFTVMNRV